MKKEIFFVGDFVTDTGPGVANRTMKKGFSGRDDVIFSLKQGKIARVPELLWGILVSRSVCFCSYSRSNFLAMRLCRLLRKKTGVIIHGFLEEESRIAGDDPAVVEAFDEYEKKLYPMADKLICVSGNSMEQFIEMKPEYKEKVTYIYNAFEPDLHEESVKAADKAAGTYTIVSIGGGMRRKNNLAVCRAVKKLRDKGYDIKYIVIGPKESDGEEIAACDLTEYRDHMPHDEILKVMRNADLYIQNSVFETFGLSPVEALFAGCSLLVSRHVGMRSLIKDVDGFVINDDSEIEQKIVETMEKPNHGELLEHFDREAVKPVNVAARLYDIMRK